MYSTVFIGQVDLFNTVLPSLLVFKSLFIYVLNTLNTFFILKWKLKFKITATFKLYQKSLKKSADMLSDTTVFQSSHQAPVCLVVSAVFPQIALSGVCIAAARTAVGRS